MAGAEAVIVTLKETVIPKVKAGAIVEAEIKESIPIGVEMPLYIGSYSAVTLDTNNRRGAYIDLGVRARMGEANCKS